jgi:hypothetical protein
MQLEQNIPTKINEKVPGYKDPLRKEATFPSLLGMKKDECKEAIGFFYN